MINIKNNNLKALLFILPAIIIMLFVNVIPIISGIYISFLKLNVNNLSKFLKAPISLINYKEIFSNKLDIGNEFILSLFNIIIFGIIVISITYILALLIALFLNQKIIGKTIIIGIVLLPYFTMDSVAYSVWNFMFSSNFNIVNKFLLGLGIINKNIIWLTGKMSMIPVIVATIWKLWPFSCIILLAGLKSIPADLYEAAKIDGANWWQRFTRITFPMLWPISAILLLLSCIWTIHSYNNFLIILGANPTNNALIPSIAIMEQLTQIFNFGRGSAMSVCLLIIVFIITFIILLLKKEKAYEI